MGPIVQELTPPVDPDRDHWRGGEHATVTLVEYGDYECPYSRLAFRAIQRLGAELDERLRFAFRHLPLTAIHPHALVAAHFAEAAALQGHFWAMHELLFQHHKALERADLWGYADQLGLDRQRLAADLDSRRVWQRVQVDADSALKAAPAAPDPVHQRAAAPWRLRRSDPGCGAGRREQGAVTMRSCRRDCRCCSPSQP